MGQRSDGFRGGVQLGSSATTTESRSIESRLRDAAAAAATGEVTWAPGLSSDELSALLGVPRGHVCGTYPDGGLWLTADRTAPLVAAEAKKQGAHGNAIERWFKNWCVLRSLDVRVYVTFCVGAGFFDGHSAQRTLETAIALEPDGPARIESGAIWNVPQGRLWLYRYREASDANDIEHVLAAAVDSTRR